MEATSNFENLKLFVTDLFSQRRLKLIDNIEISRDKESTNSGNLKIVLTIDGYYL
jgi:hypothetical protein